MADLPDSDGSDSGGSDSDLSSVSESAFEASGAVGGGLSDLSGGVANSASEFSGDVVGAASDVGKWSAEGAGNVLKGVGNFSEFMFTPSIPRYHLCSPYYAFNYNVSPAYVMLDVLSDMYLYGDLGYSSSSRTTYRSGTNNQSGPIDINQAKAHSTAELVDDFANNRALIDNLIKNQQTMAKDALNKGGTTFREDLTCPRKSDGFFQFIRSGFRDIKNKVTGSTPDFDRGQQLIQKLTERNRAIQSELSDRQNMGTLQSEQLTQQQAGILNGINGGRESQTLAHQERQFRDLKKLDENLPQKTKQSWGEKWASRAAVVVGVATAPLGVGLAILAINHVIKKNRHAKVEGDYNKGLIDGKNPDVVKSVKAPFKAFT